VGFLILSDEPEKPEYFLWRFMIDARFQRMGRPAGDRALDRTRQDPSACDGAACELRRR